MAPNQWDSEHDKNLLLLLLGFDIEISRTRFDEVATQMTNNVSGNACRQRFYKLKKESEALTNGTATTPATPTTTTPTTTTPTTTPKKPRATPGTGTGRKRKATGLAENGTANNANDNEDSLGSPGKKPKTTVKKKGAAVTATKEDEDGDEKDVTVKAEADGDDVGGD